MLDDMSSILNAIFPKCILLKRFEDNFLVLKHMWPDFMRGGWLHNRHLSQKCDSFDFGQRQLQISTHIIKVKLLLSSTGSARLKKISNIVCVAQFPELPWMDFLPSKSLSDVSGFHNLSGLHNCVT